MQVIRGLINVHQEHRHTVLTIGNFDGVHLGHQAVFAALRQRAQDFGLSSTVMIFEPQPLEFFMPDKAPPRLTRLAEKLQAIADAGVDQVLVMRFNREFAELCAELFIQRILVDGLAVQHLYIGDDFRFGRQRQGNIDTLRLAGLEHGFGVESLHTIADEHGRYSSTRIREHLQRGEFELAACCLGRQYRICGRVAHGHKQGRAIGYPTINIELKRNKSPLLGVFAVLVYGLQDGPLKGVASIGNRPVVENDDHYLLEVHLFDFDADVYGEHVQVEFVQHIRDECDFASFEQLRQQIDADARQARDILSRSTHNSERLLT
ncbi:MAG: bifunctional riboflavin kinase/FAD synthetase [Chromatiales bacterium]|jgi:riboflavin kinase/FMN adenylyltransferase